MQMFPRFPIEIQEYFIEDPLFQNQDLLIFSLVSKSWLRRSRSILCLCISDARPEGTDVTAFLKLNQSMLSFSKFTKRVEIYATGFRQEFYQALSRLPEVQRLRIYIDETYIYDGDLVHTLVSLVY